MRQSLTISLLFLVTLLSYQNCSETTFKKSASSNVDPLGKNEIIKEPQDLTVFRGNSALFDVVVSGGGHISYDWYKDDVQLESEAGDTINIVNAQMSDAGKYSVDVFVDGTRFGRRLNAKLKVLRCEAGTEKPCTLNGDPGVKICKSNGMSYGSCQTDPTPPPSDNSCNLPWGGKIANGESVKAYKSQSSSNCSSQNRTCEDGKLSGSNNYKYKSCKKSCNLPWGGSIDHGRSVKAYKNKEQQSECSSQNRKCEDGKLSGLNKYKYESCKVLGYWVCKDCHHLIPGASKDMPADWISGCTPTGICSSNSTRSCRACAQNLAPNLPYCKDYIRVEIYCKR